MTSGLINLSTGPVGISQKVMKALSEAPVSHRSVQFKELYTRTTNFLCEAFSVKQVFVFTGSGTLANEVMLHEIKSLGGRGLILSNGEFGERIMAQAKRNKLSFISLKENWGTPFNLSIVEKKLKAGNVSWILFCHCETSTGTINDLQGLTRIAKIYHCKCFADCMSTTGVLPMDLSEVSMATASSGKGLAAVPGLGIIFTNIEHEIKSNMPIYFDLGHYIKNGGIPFTLSSNLLKALYVSILEKLQPGYYDLVSYYSQTFFQQLNSSNIIPFSHQQSRVFTIVAGEKIVPVLNRHLVERRLIISSESDYLRKRGWCQLAVFGLYTEEKLKYVGQVLAETRDLFARRN